MAYNDLIRLKILSEMSDEERREYFRHKELIGAMQSLDQKVEASRHSFWKDFGANVAGNAAWDGAVWLLSRIIRKL